MGEIPLVFGLMIATGPQVVLAHVSLAYHDWRTAILLALPVTGTFVIFHAYTRERQRHARIEFLYESARELSRSSEIGPAMKDLLARALEAFRAEAAVVVFFSPDGGRALRTTVRRGAETSVLEPVEPAVAAALRALAERQEIGAAPTNDVAAGSLADYLERRALGTGMFAVMKGERSWIGAIMIGNPSGRVDRFAPDDLRLLETMANNTGIALENDRLGQTIWRMQEHQRELEHQASHDPLTDLANRILFAERINRRLAGRFSVAGQSLSVGVSTGIARGASAGTTAEELIRCADVAMYQAKQGDGRSYRLFESGMQVPARASGRS